MNYLAPLPPFGLVSPTSTPPSKSKPSFPSFKLLGVPHLIVHLSLQSIRLRLKIRVPYQSLHSHISRLQKYQQASDVLRRTSRFVVLARRLQGQMAEMQNNGTNSSGDNDDSKQIDQAKVNGLGRGLGLGLGLDREDEKERTIAKAALSIAELGRFTCMLCLKVSRSIDVVIKSRTPGWPDCLNILRF
jgi:hypothetical protein